MPSAARVGDMTSHGTPLTPASPVGTINGSQNVRIGGMSAWRAYIDIHACPKSSGNVPHVGGVAFKGSTTVYINGLPAVRQGDKIIETGSPKDNDIAAGLVSVQIGG